MLFGISPLENSLVELKLLEEMLHLIDEKLTRCELNLKQPTGKRQSLKWRLVHLQNIIDESTLPPPSNDSTSL